MPNPVISALTYFVTDTTIVATWTTDISADSNLFAGAKAGIDNGVAAVGTSHQAIVTGLLPNTLYSCHVVSGATTSASTNHTTSAQQVRYVSQSAVLSPLLDGSQTVDSTGTAPIGDTYRTFVSNDNVTYSTQDDGNGFVASTPNAGYSTEIGSITTSEANFQGTLVSLANYGGRAAVNGTDGPAGAQMSNKSTGLIGLNGNLHLFVYRQFPPTYTTNRYANWIKSTDHGATWNNFTALSTFTAAGNPVTPNSPSEPVQFYSNLVGLVTPVLYAPDDGTLGYNTAGNQIDGANGFIYMHFTHDASYGALYLMRIPRIQFDAQNASAIQYWIGPTSPSPADFVNDTNWSNTEGSETSVVNPSGIWSSAYFVPTMNSYIMCNHASISGGTQLQLFSAPTPAGPWTIILTAPNTVGGQQWYGFFPFHRSISSCNLTTGYQFRLMLNGASGGSAYNPWWTFVTLQSGPQQIFTYGFTTVENPLSDSGSFHTSPTYTALKVLSSGVCEATVAATNCLMYQSPIPVGDTGGAWPADQYAEVTVLDETDTGAGDTLYACVRQDASLQSFYLLVIAGRTGSPTSSVQTLYAFVTGTAHSLTTFNMTVSANDIIRLSVVGNVLTVTQNGTVRKTFTDTNNYVTAGSPGLGANPATILTAAQISLFSAGANQAIAPTFNPNGGSFSSTQTVEIDSTSGAGTIYYTTDGSTPTRSSSSIASGATISVAATATVKAIASVSNFVDSSIASASFTITTTATPTFSPTAGTYTQIENITISCTDSGLAGFAMYYTTDGTTPTSSSTPYTAPVRVDHSLTLKALAHTTAGGDSSIGSAAYTINIPAPSNSSGGLPVTFFGNTVD